MASSDYMLGASFGLVAGMLLFGNNTNYNVEQIPLLPVDDAHICADAQVALSAYFEAVAPEDVARCERTEDGQYQLILENN